MNYEQFLEQMKEALGVNFCLRYHDWCRIIWKMCMEAGDIAHEMCKSDWNSLMKCVWWSGAYHWRVIWMYLKKKID